LSSILSDKRSKVKNTLSFSNTLVLFSVISSKEKKLKIKKYPKKDTTKRILKKQHRGKNAKKRKKGRKKAEKRKKGRKAIKKIGAIFILFGNLSNYFQKVGKVVVKEIVWNGIKICV
jgi:hypothetical protein